MIIGGKSRGVLTSRGPHRIRATGGSADRDDIAPRVQPGAAERNRLGDGACPERRRDDAGPRRCPDHPGDLAGHAGHGGAPGRLGDGRDCAEFEGFLRHVLGIAARVDAHDHGNGVMHHELAQEGEAADVRHHGIEDDHLGPLLDDPLACFECVLGGCDDFEVRLVAQHTATASDRINAESSTMSTRTGPWVLQRAVPPCCEPNRPPIGRPVPRGGYCFRYTVGST